MLEYQPISREVCVCAQRIGAFGIHLVLEVFISTWQLGPTKLWPLRALHQMTRVDMFSTCVLVTGLISILAH